MTRYIDPTNKLLYHLDRIAALQAGETPAPVNVEIDLTNRCNLGCQACHMAHLHTKGPNARRFTHEAGDLMATPLAFKILSQLEQAGVRSITWTGGGEPMLHPDFTEIITGTTLDQGLYTNGTLISSLMAAVMKRALRWVYVSLDRHTREGYRAYKQSDLFERATAGIRNLVRAVGGATVGVGFLLDESSWQDAPAMAEFGKRLGADYVQFRPTVHFDPANPGVPQGADWINQAWGVLADLAGEPGVVLDLERFRMYEAWKEHGYSLCHWAQLQTAITPDGRVWTCVNKRGYPGECLGDLNETPFAEIWEKQSGAAAVCNTCRVFCRGHIPNLTLDRIFGEAPDHWRFI